MPKLLGMLPNYFEHWLEPVFELAIEYAQKPMLITVPIQPCA